MSKPSAPSIPTSPQPGKDPPPLPAPFESKSEAFPSTSTSPNPPTLSPQPTSQDSTTKNKFSMPPPPPPTRPTITTQPPSLPPSRSTTFHPSTIPSNINSQNLHSASQTSTFLQEEEKPRPPFTPFFTLINDVKEKEGESSTYHPSRIHYIFSDDDAGEVLGGALLRAQTQTQTHPQALLHSQGPEDQSTTTSSNSSTFLKKGKRKDKENENEHENEKEERIIIVDVNESGDGIQRISSLSQNWQITNATIDNAPTWDGATENHGHPTGGLMLRIEGVSIPPPSISPNPSPFTSAQKGKMKEGGEAGGGGGGSGSNRGSGMIGSDIVSEEEMATLLEGFDRKMAVLRRVVGQHSDPHPSASPRGHRREGSGGSGAGGQGGGGESAVS